MTLFIMGQTIRVNTCRFLCTIKACKKEKNFLFVKRLRILAQR